MKNLQELIHTPEYWMEKIQNEIFRQVYSYMEEEGLNQSQLASKFNLSKGYISQILNGNFNFSLKTLVDLSLKLGIAPDLQFEDMASYVKNEVNRVKRISASTKINFDENNFDNDIFRESLKCSQDFNFYENVNPYMKVSYKNAS